MNAQSRHVLVVGGLERLERDFELVGEELGMAVETHTGDVRGRGSRELESKVGRADLVVVLTSLVSHGGMLLAKKHARAAGKPLRIVRGGAVAAIRALLSVA